MTLISKPLIISITATNKDVYQPWRFPSWLVAQYTAHLQFKFLNFTLFLRLIIQTSQKYFINLLFDQNGSICNIERMHLEVHYVDTNEWSHIILLFLQLHSNFSIFPSSILTKKISSNWLKPSIVCYLLLSKHGFHFQRSSWHMI